jgi:hypothetical protein
MVFEDFPAFCINDIFGNDYYKSAREQWSAH